METAFFITSNAVRACQSVGRNRRFVRVAQCRRNVKTTRRAPIRIVLTRTSHVSAAPRDTATAVRTNCCTRILIPDVWGGTCGQRGKRIRNRRESRVKSRAFTRSVTLKRIFTRSKCHRKRRDSGVQTVFRKTIFVQLIFDGFTEEMRFESACRTPLNEKKKK